MNPFFSHPTALVESQQVGAGTRIWAFAHVLQGAVIGTNCNIGDHCFIENAVRIGDEVVIKNGVSVWSGVTLEDRVFVGPNVVFTNDHVPRAKVFHSSPALTLVRRGASLGANATLVAPVTIGRFAIVGAGSVVTRPVPDYGLVYGNPGRLIGFGCECGERLPFAVDADGRASCSCSRLFDKHGPVVSRVMEEGDDVFA